MAYSSFRNGFNIQSDAVIDKRIYLTKAEMLRESDEETALYMLPECYFALCADDGGRIYLYNANNTPNATTGKFVPIDATLAFDSAEAKAKFEDALNNSASFTSLSESVADLEPKVDKAAEDIEKLNNWVENVTVNGGEVSAPSNKN